MKSFTALAFTAISFFTVAAQKDTLKNKKDGGYYFTKITEAANTSVKNQCNTSTCWSFSTLSFLESELARKGKGNIDLSEMFIVRCAYMEKAMNYIRMNGNANFNEGGEPHDIPAVIAKYGIVPESVYKGLNYGEEKHHHTEMVMMMKGALEKLKDNPQGTYTPVWPKAISGILDAYLGKFPDTFTYEGKQYTPKTYAASLGLNMDDYVVLTSFTHHPFYKPFAIEVADNWAMQSAYNISLDEFMSTMKNALNKGLSIEWASDVSEKGFSMRDGVAIVPVNDSFVKAKNQSAHFTNVNGTMVSNSAFDQPKPEKKITPEIRQEAFDRQTTTDDHGMHIVGLYKDQNGTLYFKVKNSWGTDFYNLGYFYASETYVMFKTISIMVPKEALSKELKAKLKID